MLNETEKQGVYKAIWNRRDIRSFLSKEIPKDALKRIIEAGHHGPSVGFMQPWNFIIVTDEQVKDKLAWACEKERQALAIHYEDTKKENFLSLKIAGIKEAPVTICITCDPTRGGSHVLGRNSIPETDILSTACAIENMWLAAYAEGIAMGWVSFYKKNDVRDILHIPPHVEPVALLSLGYTENYPKKPILETSKWRDRLPLESLISYNEWKDFKQE
ncbi:MAG TPA: 5,6-dimethylbenzimidazole synthase [Massilibacterium sp.]|nr:5,6-dimethylbenzimidazole synthase [Massilibacterium sp.]